MAQVLEESAAGRSDQADSMFEIAVMMFLRGDQRGAVAKLLEVQQLARSRGAEGAAMEAEVYKWLGHCWIKLADARKAEQYFMEGAEFAHARELRKAEADCLSGLGMLHRSQNDPARAMMYLGRQGDMIRPSPLPRVRSLTRASEC